jgi:hypothetical protein
MRGSQQGDARYTDLILTFARLGNIVRRLHTHQRVHLYSKGFLDPERHVPERSALPLSRLGNIGRETRNATPLCASALTP